MRSPRKRADLANQTAFINALTAPRQAVGGVNNGRGRSADDRFAVYRNNVAHSLSEALGTTFAATRDAMGRERFRPLALAHIREEPPQSPVLFRYGATFPNRLSDPVLRDLAQLEYQRVQAFHAADAAPIGLDALGAVAPEALPTLVFTAHPATSCLPLSPDALAIFLRHTGAEPAPEAARALITRPAFDVTVTPLSAPIGDFATALFAGQPLGEAAAIDGLDLGAALATLFNAGAISALG